MRENHSPETPLRELFGKARWSQCLAKQIDLFLQKRATAADLADVDPDKFEAWLRLQFADSTVVVYMDLLRAVLRKLALIPGRIAVGPGHPGSGRTGRPLSDADGTLWGICLK